VETKRRSDAGGSLDPAVLDRLEGLSLVARTLVEGFLASWPGTIAPPSAAARPSSPSTASTSPATSCGAWTGRSSPAPTGL
jgi:hypothetical protein